MGKDVNPPLKRVDIRLDGIRGEHISKLHTEILIKHVFKLSPIMFFDLRVNSDHDIIR